MTLIALLVGLAVCFGGYRWFLILLPIWGFFFGFAIGAQTIQAIFEVGFLVTITSWIVGFFVGLVFAVLSYLFYIVGVALFAGAFGYAVAVGLLQAIGLDFGLIVWLVGIVGGVVVAALTLLLNIQKWVIIFITSFGGAGLIIGAILLVFGVINPADAIEHPVRAVLDDSVFWLIFFLVVGVLGFAGQAINTQNYVLEAPENRM
jgi:hypothetical protein